VRHRQPKGPATDRPNLTHRATSRFYTIEVTLYSPITALSEIWRQLHTKEMFNFSQSGAV
jgi:hypothetical protein